MLAKKQNFLEKIVKRNYNNELEKLLEEKQFEENAKSTLLNILYKIETGYKDIETVKKDIETKEEYIENLMGIIKNNCNSIKILKMSEQNNQIPENRTYIIDKENKEIIAYPIERKVLYAIAKIGKKEKIIKDNYFLIDETISDLINTGNNIIKRANLENLKTNMLLIEVKGKEYVENGNFNLGTSFDKLTDENEKNKRIELAKSKLKGTEITSVSDLNSNFGITQEQFQQEQTNLIFYYKLTKEDLEELGMSNEDSNNQKGGYIIKYDLKNMELEIYNTIGFKSGDKTYYSLSELENLEI